MLTLDLAIVTHRPEGIARVAAMNLPVIDGVRYIISWQNHDGAPVPDSLIRRDIDIHRFDGQGISLNRNNAYDHCSADIVLNSDDDLIYTPEQIKSVIRTFESHPEVEVATFKARMDGSAPYPAQSIALTDPLPKGYWVASINIAFRRLSAGNLRMHPDLGLGSPKMHGAEDELFLLAAIRRGLNCRYFPVEICTHPAESTGTKSALTAANLRASGCYLAIAYPVSCIFRLPLKALRIARSGRASFFMAFRCLFSGASYAPAILRGDRKYLW